MIIYVLAMADTPNHAWNLNLKKSLQAYVDADENVGVAVTTIRNGEVHSEFLGSTVLGKMQPPTSETVFQIGSATKVFTGLVLSFLVNEHRVALEDPILKFFPAIQELQQGAVGKITLRELATHTSGLPKLPKNFTSFTLQDPYQLYSESQLLASLKDPHLLKHRGPYPPRYSNYGMGLLGYILTRITGKSYDEMIKQIVMQPLGMLASGVWVSPSEHHQSAEGYTEAYERNPFWSFRDSMVGAGGIHSSLFDMTLFLKANLDPDSSPLGKAIAYSHELQVESSEESVGIPKTADLGLAWILSTVNGDHLIWHNGEVGGYASFIGINQTKHLALELMTNTANLKMQECLLDLLTERKCHPITADESIPGANLAQKTGKYYFKALPSQWVEIKKPGHFLSASFNHQYTTRLRAVNQDEYQFSIGESEDRVSFKKNGLGETDRLVLDEEGIKNSAYRKKSNEITLSLHAPSK